MRQIIATLHRIWIYIFLFGISLVFYQCEKESQVTEPVGTDYSALKSTSNITSLEYPFVYEGTLSQGGLYLLSIPENWDGINLLVYAHGYVDPDEELALPSDSLDNRSMEDIINGLGWAFASTSFSENGLAVLTAVDDLAELRDSIYSKVIPENIYLAGPSEGGLITTLTLERYPGYFNGGLATCCPIGNFYRQLQYFGDFHVLFRYFFNTELIHAGINIGSPEGVPESTMHEWKNGDLKNRILMLMSGNEDKVAQLLNCSKVPVDRYNPESVAKSILDILRFNIMATNDINQRLGGCIYNNAWPRRIYLGSKNDWLLNRTIERIKTNNFETAKIAENELETTGNIKNPLITMHTTGDHIALYWHQTIYRSKIFKNRAGFLHNNIPVVRYGHCTFTHTEVLAGLALLVFKTTLTEMVIPETYFNSDADANKFLSRAREIGANPVIQITSEETP
ncbi:MAG: hypothetical protein JXJ22_00685 [Bacteroidales bacterium]|nr:hypothetical protein [Bacteroidales bacterium]